MQNIACWCDRITAEKKIQLCFFCGRHQSPGSSLVPGYIAVTSRSKLCGCNLIADFKNFCGFTVIPSSFQHTCVCVANIWFLVKLLINPIECRFERKIVHPVHHPQSKKVFGTINQFAGKVHLLKCNGCQFCNVNFK